jgi:cleavage and polyadenylation specificity factor subunit 3
VTATAAGHVLGAAMFSIVIDNIKILYTGDYSMEEDRHLIQAEIPPGSPPDILIVESTFGTTKLQNREGRETLFTRTVEGIVTRGGSCLIPVFALGRAQELLLILDEYWKENHHLQHIPILYASKLATKSLRVYQTFVNMMNTHVRQLSDMFQNPFRFSHIRSMITNDFDLSGPSVVMASPGFLQSGVSRQLFEAWCDDERNGVILAGYTVQGTLAHQLLDRPDKITCLDNRIKDRRCQVENISFSAHVGYDQNLQFIRSVCPDHIVLVHGEQKQMFSLKVALEEEIKHNWPSSYKPRVVAPENGTSVRFPFRKNIVADVVGTAAIEIIQNLDSTKKPITPNVADTTGINLPSKTMLVTENFTSSVLTTEDFGTLKTCKLGNIKERLVLPVPQDISMLLMQTCDNNGDSNGDSYSLPSIVLTMLIKHLQRVYDNVEYTNSTEIQVQGLVSIGMNTNIDTNKIVRSLSSISVSWNASPIADMLADSIVGLLTQLLSAPNLVRKAIQMNGRSTYTSRLNGGNDVKEEPAAQKRRM